MMTSMKKLFGTDGMRGEAGRFPLDEATVRAAGRSLARRLEGRLGRPQVLIGRDTRESGEWVCVRSMKVRNGFLWFGFTLGS